MADLKNGVLPDVDKNLIPGDYFDAGNMITHITMDVLRTTEPCPIGHIVQWCETFHYKIIEEFPKDADGNYRYLADKISPSGK